MLTIHHNAETIPARTIPAYDETYYEFSELSDDAQEAAIDDWRREYGDEYLAMDTDEAYHSLMFIIDQLPNHSMSFYCGDECSFICCDDAEPFARRATVAHDGYCDTMDFADAYNKHSDRIRYFGAIVDATRYDSPLWDAAYALLEEEVDDALDDMRRAYNDRIEELQTYHWSGEYLIDSSAAFLFSADGERFDRSEIEMRDVA